MNDLVGLVSNHQQEFTPLIKLFIVMTFMMFLPTIIFMMTSFVRIIITFSFLKSALGAQQSIPNQILVGIALVLTIFIMSPVVDKINKEAIQPYREEKITFQEGIEKAQIPMKEFLLKQTRDEDIKLFLDSARIDKNDATRENLPLQVLVPAFAISEYCDEHCGPEIAADAAQSEKDESRCGCRGLRLLCAGGWGKTRRGYGD